MKRIVKILCGLLAVLAVALCVGILLTVIGWPVREVRMQEWVGLIRRFPFVLLTIAAALIIGALGVFALYGLFSEHLERPTASTIEKNALGEISVAHDALETIANRIVNRHDEIKSGKTKIITIGDRVKIAVRVVTSPEVSLLTVTHALQEEIAVRVREICGVSVGTVDVTVDQTDEPPKPSRIN